MNRRFVFLLLLWGLSACLGARFSTGSEPSLDSSPVFATVPATESAATEEPNPPAAIVLTHQLEHAPPIPPERDAPAAPTATPGPKTGDRLPPTSTSLRTADTLVVASLNPAQAPPTAVPPAAAMIARDPHITVYALLGNDHVASKNGRTDSMILVALNPQAKRVTLLSLPRDLYVVMPGWKMGRLNLAYALGGEDLFRETVAYNLGLPVDHTIRVGFAGFKQIVDALGGIEVVVNCPVEDWRLRAPDLDPQLESSWEPYELSYGIQSMDGNLALWYARSRLNSNDFDRGRRQQKILHALWQKVRHSPDSLAQLPELVNALWTAVQSDLSLTQALTLAAQAPGWVDNRVEHLLLPQEALHPWQVPGSGEAVQLLDYETAAPILSSFLSEPALGAARASKIRVVIESEDVILYRQAADNLAWYGFQPIYEPPGGDSPSETTISFVGSSLKGVYPNRLAWILRQETADIKLQSPTPKATPYYYVRLARDYNPCLDYFDGPEVSEQWAVSSE